MNKKLLVALLLPMMMLPMTAFGYAHWTDRVTKQIKLHAGTVDVHIVQYHVDICNSYDVDCDGVVFGDEFKIEVREYDGQVKEVLITADPVFPDWELEFKMLIHNKGRLIVDSHEHYWNWIGPEVADPCFLDQPTDDPATHYPDTQNVPPGFVYVETLWLHDYSTFPACRGTLCLDKTHYQIPTSPTAYSLKPCECVMLKE